MAMISNVSLPGNQREASNFSSFNGELDNFVRNLENKEDDGEIGVFGAEKYFNSGMDNEPPIPVFVPERTVDFIKIAEKHDLESMEKSKNYHGTPSVRSESSCNSKSALLQSSEKTQTKKMKNRGINFLSICKSSCCDKSSVDVMEESVHFETQNPGEISVKRSFKVDEFKIIESRSWLKEGIGETFTFPISKPESGKFPMKSMDFSGDLPFSFRRNPTCSEEGELESSPVDGALYNDAASDCSSDLFEIESLAGKSSGFQGRRSSDATSCFTHTTCYAPSEVSIDWSVVTASAADFSAISDYDSDQKPAGVKSNPVPKWRTGILLGCKNEKAVGVAMDAYRKNEKGGSDAAVRRSSGAFTPLRRFEGETKVAGVSLKQRNQTVSSLSYPRPLQNQVANLLEIQ